MMFNRFLSQSIFFMWLSVSSIVNSQEAVPVSGGNIKSTAGSVSFSVGQVFQSFNHASNGSVAEGVQQPFEISVVSGIFQLPDFSLSIFPNPSTVFIMLKIENTDVENMTYQLFDLQGKKIMSSSIFEKETIIVTETLMPSNYILKVYQGRNELKAFKIIKQ